MIFLPEVDPKRVRSSNYSTWSKNLVFIQLNVKNSAKRRSIDPNNDQSDTNSVL